MLYICPVCADFFDTPDTFHCLKCNHHYPATKEDNCKICGTSYSEGYQAIPTPLKKDDIPVLSEWSTNNGYKRGVYKYYIPGDGEYEGGIRIR
jgi:hypothetical protein